MDNKDKDEDIKNFEKWRSQVNGSEKQLQDALKKLKGNPKSVEELQKTIYDQMKVDLRETLEEAEKGKKFSPY